MATSKPEQAVWAQRRATRSWLRAAGHWLVPVGGAVAIFVASFALLELGLPGASSGERFAAATLRPLEFTYGAEAVMDINGRRLVAHCRTYSAGRVVITLSNGHRLLEIGTHIYPATNLPQALSRLRRGRHLFVHHDIGLLAAEADLAGSHRLYALELAGALANITIRTHSLRYRGRLAYALTLNRKPSFILIVSQSRHKPIAAFYRSATIRASSRLLKELPARVQGPGC